MNVIKSHGNFMVYKDGVQTYPELPCGIYRVSYDKQIGFYLESDTFSEVTEKIYGDVRKWVDTAYRTFSTYTRNFGVLLSGEKGSGKSVFSKLMAYKCLENNIPVIIIDTYIVGISEYLKNIEQKCCVICDEFDKVFKPTDDNCPQDELLPMLDGIDIGKKMFLFTCNDANNVNKFIVDRPGRCHYHFRFNLPKPDAIREYLMDNIPQSYYSEIDKVVVKSFSCSIHYDALRAIAFELSNGVSFEEAFEILNIGYNCKRAYNVEAVTSDGKIFSVKLSLDLDNSNEISTNVFSNTDDSRMSIHFNPKDIIWNQNGIGKVYLTYCDSTVTVYADT